MSYLRLLPIALVALTLSTAAPAINAEEAEADWSELDLALVEQFMQRFMSPTPDAQEYLAAFDEFASEQQEKLIAPLEVDGQTNSPMAHMLGYFIGNASAQKKRAFIEFGEGIVQRAHSDVQRGHWLAWVSRARLMAAENIELARESAAQAQALGTALCVGECGPRVNAWLSGTPLEASTQERTRLVFDPRPSSCAKQPISALSGSDPGHFSDEWLERVLNRQEDAVSSDMDQWWKAKTGACQDHSSYALREHIDKQFPAMLIQQSYASAVQTTSTSRAPARIAFLDYKLDLPTSECDFAKAPDCSATQALRAESARMLVSQLRNLSQSLRPISMCMRGSEGEEDKHAKALQERYEAEIKTLDKGSAGEAIQALELLLVAEQFQPLGDDRASYEVMRLLAKLATEGESARALSLWQRTMPALDQPWSAHKQLMAKLLLHHRRGAEAESLLRGLAESGADEDASRAWFQLRAGLEGADLTVVGEAPERPWSVRAGADVRANYSEYGPDLEVTIDDIRFGTQSPTAALDALLQTSWVELLDQPWQRPDSLQLALRSAYPGARWTAQFELALRSISAEPELGFVLSGRWLPLPDQLCTEEGCEAADAEQLRELFVQRGLMPAEG